MPNSPVVPRFKAVFSRACLGILLHAAAACGNAKGGNASADATVAADADAASVDVQNGMDGVADSSEGSAGGFFLTGHAEAFAQDSKATGKIAFSVVDDAGKPVALTVRKSAPDYRLEMAPPGEYPHYYTPSFALEGLPGVTANPVYKPGFSGTPVSDTAGVQQVELTRGTPIGVCGILAISPYDGTMLVRGLNQWQRVRMAGGVLETTPIAGGEMSGQPVNTQQGGGPIEDCATVQGELDIRFLPGGRFALLTEPMKVGGDYAYAVFDLANSELVMHIPIQTGTPLRLGQNQQFALIDQPQTYNSMLVRWDQGQVTTVTIAAAAPASSPDGRYFLQSLQLAGKYVRYDAQTQETVLLMDSPPPLLAHGPNLGAHGDFLIWGDANESLIGPADCTQGYSDKGCTLRLLQPGGQPVTVTTQGFDYAVSLEKRALLYVTPSALMRYDVDSGAATQLPVTLKFDPNESFGLFNPGVGGALTLGNLFIVRDLAALHVVDIDTGTELKQLPGFWSTISPFNDHAVALKGICMLGRDKDPGYCKEGILDVQTGVYSDTRNLYADGKRSFVLEQGILQVGDAVDPNGPHDVIFPAYGFPTLAAGFKGGLTLKAPCVPYVRPPAGKLNGTWLGYDTLCVP
jgi:hypothetical protein